MPVTTLRPETSARVLLLPGWRDSGPGHWQTRWAGRHGFERVEQADWEWPKRGDWLARLDEVVADPHEARPVVLVAHSLGCLAVAAWAAVSRHTARVRGALLVAPPDVERSDVPPQLSGWRPIARRSMPFTTVVVSSDDDPYASPSFSAALAAAWGARHHDLRGRGHLNAESGLGDWDDGRSLLEALLPADGRGPVTTADPMSGPA